MKKLIMILLAATAFSCGDGNRSSERKDMDGNNESTEQAAPDTTNTDEYGRQDSEMNEQDTTSTYDRNESDSLKNK
jgi:hypothetical protein